MIIIVVRVKVVGVRVPINVQKHADMLNTGLACFQFVSCAILQ